jgi:hypothetical protein
LNKKLLFFPGAVYKIKGGESMEISKVAFLEAHIFDNSQSMMGGILVTDADTKPLEFRVTAPVKPTNFQRTLYGDVLSEHILVELIGVPLINAINEEIDLILVRDPLFLGINNKQGIRVIRVFKEGETTSGNACEPEELKSSPGEKIKTFAEISKKFESELSGIADRLNTMSEVRNLLEPFERLKTACEQVQQQKTGE